MGVVPRAILVDVDDGPLATSLTAAWPDRGQRRQARSAPDAVDVVAGLAPATIVVAPVAPADGAATRVDIHAAIVERTRWWCRAATVTGAFVVLVGHADVFDDPAGPAPDEATPPVPTTPVGRAWRLAETAAHACGGAVVRSVVPAAESPDPAATTALADLVAWVVAGRHAGTWHLGGGMLDDLHTRVVRGTARPDPRT